MDMTAPDTPAQIVRQHRDIHGLRRKDLAAESGVSERTIARLEDGAPIDKFHRDNLRNIATVMGSEDGTALLKAAGWDDDTIGRLPFVEPHEDLSDRQQLIISGIMRLDDDKQKQVLDVIWQLTNGEG